jgi:hypothetical protein
MGPLRRWNGALEVIFPTGDARIPWMGAEDIGIAAHEIFLRGDALVYESIGISGEHLTGAQLARQLSDLFGEPVAYNAMTPDAYRALGFPGSRELGNMFQFKRDFEAEYCARRDVKRSRALHPGIADFATWLRANGTRIPVAQAA